MTLRSTDSQIDATSEEKKKKRKNVFSAIFVTLSNAKFQLLNDQIEKNMYLQMQFV